MRGLLDGLVGVTKTVVTRVELGGPLFLAAVIGVLLEGYPWHPERKGSAPPALRRDPPVGWADRTRAYPPRAWKGYPANFALTAF
jgi:hypothetical protein